MPRYFYKEWMNPRNRITHHNQFESKLDKQYQYYFELVHYDNIINISYESKFYLV